MKKVLISLIVIFSPLLSFAVETIEGLVLIVADLLNKIIPILITLGLVYFFWGIVDFIKNVANENKKEDAKKKIFWGIISLFVILSVWGLVALVANTFGIEQGGFFGVA